MPYFPFSLQNGLLQPPPQTPVTAVDLTDPNGLIQTARLINPATGDYQVDETGHFVGMNQINQDVQLALLTTFGSASTAIGNTLKSIRLITPNLQQQVQIAVKTCLANLINSKKITLGTVVVKNLGNGNVSLYVPFTNLTTGQDLTHNIPLGV